MALPEQQCFIDPSMSDEARESLSREDLIDYRISLRLGQIVGGVVTPVSADSLKKQKESNRLAYAGISRQIGELLEAEQRAAAGTPPEGWIKIEHNISSAA